MKTVVMIPTYNEAENIVPLLREIGADRPPGLHALVVDDSSPDGTSELARGFAAENAWVSVMTRTGPKGRGHAGREGYLRALADGAERIVEMDADFSHHPRYLPALVAAADDCDVVLGSRFVGGGEDADRSLWRKVVTLLANRYIRIMLRIPVSDCNSGYRCFRRDALEKIDPGSLVSAGPAIVQEVLFRAQRRGLTIREIPVVFTDRVQGTSKLSWNDLYQGYVAVLKLRWRELTGRDS